MNKDLSKDLVKANVIRIVQGLPPEEHKQIVELGADQIVVDAAAVKNLQHKFEYGGYEVGSGGDISCALCGEDVNHSAHQDESAPESAPEPTGQIPKPFIRFGMFGDNLISPREPSDVLRFSQLFNQRNQQMFSRVVL